jgi:chemotaxis protein MotB
MVEPNDGTRRQSRKIRASTAIGAVLAALQASGCSLIPKGKLDECHRVTQTLRAENSRLKDVALDLRAQNQDLSQRAVDDANRIAAQEEAVERMEKSVQAYQAEREQLAAALEVIKRQVRLAVSPRGAALPARLDSYVSAHPGWSFDRSTNTLSAPFEGLFERGSDRLRPEAIDALKALASELSEARTTNLSLEVLGPPEPPPVVRAGYEEDAGSDLVTTASARFLRAARAARIRDQLVELTGIDPAHARLAGARANAEPADDASAQHVEIRFGIDAPAPTLDSAPKAHP